MQRRKQLQQCSRYKWPSLSAAGSIGSFGAAGGFGKMLSAFELQQAWLYKVEECHKRGTKLGTFAPTMEFQDYHSELDTLNKG